MPARVASGARRGCGARTTPKLRTAHQLADDLGAAPQLLANPDVECDVRSGHLEVYVPVCPQSSKPPPSALACELAGEAWETMIAAGWPRRRMSAEKLPKAVMNQADTIQRYRGDRSIPNAATS